MRSRLGKQPHWAAKYAAVAQRDALVETVAGALLGGVRSPVLARAFEYWKSIDPAVGQRIEDKVRSGSAPKPAEGMGEA
ncbi:MAG: hypothetical protein IPP82_05300 [Xanthomonadales bacterium]|nr:hypothetical protein [Xanthomonadales bacterium]